MPLRPAIPKRSRAPLTAPCAPRLPARQNVPTNLRPIPGASRPLSLASKLQGSSFRVSTLFTALLSVGIGITAYGLYEFYNTFTMWPKEVRDDLRAGIKAKHQQDYALSERYLRRAYETALSLPLDAFAPLPHLKLSGIAAALGEALEHAGRAQDAYETYAGALAQLRAHWDALAGEERLRAVALAHRLGSMAGECGRDEVEEERWLRWAVEEVLRIARDADAGKRREGDAGEEAGLVLAELDLPAWVSKTDVGAPMEALAEFHARTGNTEYAVILYNHVLALLHNKRTEDSFLPEDLCRAATVLNNVAGVLMRGTPTPETLDTAEDFARRALEVLGDAAKNKKSIPPEDLQTCAHTFAVTLFNVGSLREMHNDRDTARAFYQASLKRSKELDLPEGIAEAKQALRRLDREGSNAESTAVSPTDITEPST